MEQAPLSSLGFCLEVFHKRNPRASLASVVALANGCSHSFAERILDSVLYFQLIRQGWQDMSTDHDNAVAITQNSVTGIAHDVTACYWRSNMAWPVFGWAGWIHCSCVDWQPHDIELFNVTYCAVDDDGCHFACKADFTEQVAKNGPVGFAVAINDQNISWLSVI